MIAIKKHILSVCLSEFCCRLSYYGLQSLLILYVIAKFHVGDVFGYTLYGHYVALTFSCCILGGIISNKLIHSYQSVLTGTFLLLVGNIIIINTQQFFLFCLGVSATVIAIGLIKPATASLIGFVHKKMIIKNKLFIYFYIVGNLGSILGPFFYGFGVMLHKYWIGFTFSVIILTINLCFLYRNKQIRQINNLSRNKVKLTVALILISLGIIYCILLGKISILCLFTPLAIFFAVHLIKVFKSFSVDEKESIHSLVIPMLASVLFFTAFLQLFSSITVFIHENIQLYFFSLKVPAGWFGSIEAFLLFVIAKPVMILWEYLQNRNRAVSSKHKITWGLNATFLAFSFFALSGYFAENNTGIAVTAILIGNLFLAMGELCIIPTSIALISESVPNQHLSFFIGIFYFSLSLSGYFSSFIADVSKDMQKLNGNGFLILFILIAIFFALFSLGVYLYNYLFNKLSCKASYE